VIARFAAHRYRMEFIPPDWPAPANVRAGTSTRAGGVSRGAYASLNLGAHVGDEPAAVERNREMLCATLALPAQPLWLTQVHGTAVVDAAGARAPMVADGSFTDRPATVCAVLSADCLPVFLCNRTGTKVGLVHAGWRGLAAGVIEAGVRALQTPGAELLAAFGPAISGRAYEVGADVRAMFVQHDPASAAAFTPHTATTLLADLYALARLRLSAAGVHAVYGGHYCTASQPEKFFSYRRDGTTGRMASLIWRA